MTLKAFVAGATGFTGREVARVLAAQGIQTTAHVRPDSSRLEEWRSRFSEMGAAVDTTPWDENAMGSTLQNLAPNLVFALLGTTAKRARTAKKEGADASYERIDYGLTALLIRAAAMCAQPPRFVYLSSMGAGGESTAGYMGARTRSENDLTASGLPYTIARPSFIIGDRDDDRWGESMGARSIDAALATIGFFGAKTLHQRYRSTSNTALAEALVRLSLDPEAGNQVFLSDQLHN